MVEYEKMVREVLECNGCEFVRLGAGDYEIWYSEVTGKHFPVDLVIKSRRHANIVLRHGGIDSEL